MEMWMLILLVPLVAVGAWAALRGLHSFGKQVGIERALEMFKLQRERLEAQFFTAAAASGKPRGLIWKDCQWEDPVIFVREVATGQINALVGVTIAFEAVPGGDMEGLPAVGNLRNASAVFAFAGGQWRTHGKAIFNMNPNETVQHFQGQYVQIV